MFAESITNNQLTTYKMTTSKQTKAANHWTNLANDESIFKPADVASAVRHGGNPIPNEPYTIDDQGNVSLPDEFNPEFLFSLTPNLLLISIIKGHVDPVALAKAQLANRGYDLNNQWVGFKK